VAIDPEKPIHREPDKKSVATHNGIFFWSIFLFILILTFLALLSLRRTGRRTQHFPEPHSSVILFLSELPSSRSETGDGVTLASPAVTIPTPSPPLGDPPPVVSVTGGPSARRDSRLSGRNNPHSIPT
jgi:hypothetical protein